MDIDATRFRKIVRMVFEQVEPGYRDDGRLLSPGEAQAIVKLARLAVDADDREDEDEVAILDTLVDHVCKLAGVAPPPLEALPRDDLERSARLAELVPPIAGKASGALAYIIVYLLIVSDMDIAPAETRFVEQVRDAVGLDQSRGQDLAASAAEIVTPGE